MKRVIWIYEIGMYSELEMPQDAEFLDLQVQNENIVAWFMLRPGAVSSTRKFKIYGTGHEINDNEKYLGTAQEPPYVWHIFEVIQ